MHPNLASKLGGTLKDNQSLEILKVLTEPSPSLPSSDPPCQPIPVSSACSGGYTTQTHTLHCWYKWSQHISIYQAEPDPGKILFSKHFRRQKNE